MAKKDVVRLLAQLFGDPKLHDSIRQDPEAELKKLGLTEKERALLTSRNEKAIRDYLGKEAEKVLIVTHWLPTNKE